MDTENKSKTVATIDINIQWPDKKAWLEESLDDHFHCVLCGGTLNFKHKTNFVELTVHEEAHCPTCGVRNRQGDYRLQ